MTPPIVAIIGRRNVGKSTLFNRLVGRREAIVDSQEGVTRDRIYGEVEWKGIGFSVVDTGGYIPDRADVMDTAVRKQVEIAMDEADLVVLMVDGRHGAHPDDAFLGRMVGQSGKPSLLVVNKIDSEANEEMSADFFSLGFDRLVTLSAAQGRKVGDFLDRVVEILGETGKTGPRVREEAVRVAIVGMPNVGKSSVANRILGQEKSIVTDIPGTTRDAVDSRLKFYGKTYVLIDTGGLRRKARVKEPLEYYSSLRAERAITRAHVVMVIVDAAKGFGRQDQQIVRRVLDAGRGLVVAVNKWDLVDAGITPEWVRSQIIRSFSSLMYYPFVFVSAKTGRRISRLLPESREVFSRYQRKVPTGVLNRVLRDALGSFQVPAVRGKNIRIKYVTQVGVAPPSFAFFCNFPGLVPDRYKGYLENRLREEVDFEGVPLKFSFRRS
ncbi:MAG: ribosome biogenesis GTPase Der [Fidelibacterota bacterium]